MLTIYVINILERKDRWNRIQSIYSKHINLVRVDAVKHAEGWKGCFLSHKKCLQLAKDTGMRNIIVMEDDCIPFINIIDFVTRLHAIKLQLDRLKKWHIFLGGVFGTGMNFVRPFGINHHKYLRLEHGFCTHLMIYNHTSYDFFLNHPLNKPIDHVWHKKLVALVSLPFLANQYDNFSNIRQKYVTDLYSKIIRCNAELLRKSVMKAQLAMTFK